MPGRFGRGVSARGEPSARWRSMTSASAGCGSFTSPRRRRVPPRQALIFQLQLALHQDAVPFRRDYIAAAEAQLRSVEERTAP
jgi:hypothetical protein